MTNGSLRSLFRILLLLPCLLLSACASVPHQDLPTPGGTETVSPEALPDMQLVALDFVQAFMQIDPLMESGHPILLQDPYSEFGLALGNALAEVGLTLATPDARRAVLPVSHDVQMLEVIEGSLPQVLVSAYLNDVGLQRTYRLETGALYPDSAFLIRGYDPRDMNISNDLFALGYPDALNFLTSRFKQERGALAERLPVKR